MLDHLFDTYFKNIQLFSVFPNPSNIERTHDCFHQHLSFQSIVESLGHMLFQEFIKFLDFLETKSTGASKCSHRTNPTTFHHLENLLTRQLALQCSAFLDQSCLSGYLSSGNFFMFFCCHKKNRIKS